MYVFLEVENVSKRFGEVVAVDDASFGCERGELLSLLGPSGCGKTTLLRLIAGFEQSDSGNIRLAGEPLAGKSPEARQVGIVFQNFALFPHMTVAENIAYGLRFRSERNQRPRRAARSQRVSDLLEMVGLAGYQGRRPDQLSAGQQQRVAIARALAPAPRLLLMDEPLSALDASLREHLRLQIRIIQRQLDVTTVYVTHDQEEALAISDRVIIMQGGQIEQIGTPVDIYERPASRFVASFVGRTSLVPSQSLRGKDAPKGQLAVLRAERLSPEGIGTPQLRGRLIEVEYGGPIVRLQVETEAGTVWASAPGPSLTQWAARRGEPVDLYLDMDGLPFVPAGD